MNCFFEIFRSKRASHPPELTISQHVEGIKKNYNKKHADLSETKRKALETFIANWNAIESSDNTSPQANAMSNSPDEENPNIPQDTNQLIEPDSNPITENQDNIEASIDDTEHSESSSTELVPEPTLVSDPIEETEDKVPAAMDYPYLIQLYQNKRIALQKEDYDKDIFALQNERKLYEALKKNVVQFAANFENDLYFVFTETVENHEFIERDINNKKLYITLPLDGDKDTINKLLKKVTEDIGTVQDIDNVPYANLRQPRDLDFRIGHNAPVEIQSFLKRKLNSLVVNLKILDNSRKEFIILYNNVFSNEKTMYSTPDSLNTDRFFEIIAQEEKTQEEKVTEVDSLFDEALKALQTNNLKVSEARKLVEKFEKSYVEMLNKTLFKLYNSLRDAETQYPQELKALDTEQQKVLDDCNWSRIYSVLKTKLVDFMSDNLNIVPLEAKRGDDYQDELHNPVLESEPDSELQDNQLKEVFNDGFIRLDERGRVVLKPANVQVVSNELS